MTKPTPKQLVKAADYLGLESDDIRTTIAHGEKRAPSPTVTPARVNRMLDLMRDEARACDAVADMLREMADDQ